MKIVLTDWCCDWKGQSPQPIAPTVLDLDDNRILTFFLVSLGNETYEEICVEVDSMDTYEFVRALFIGTGGAKRVEADPSTERSRLHRKAYEIYVQPPDADFFLNPFSRPDLFRPNGLASYAAEFA